MCGCEICTLFEDMHSCLLAFRKDKLSQWRREISNMNAADGQVEEMKLKEYAKMICIDEEGSAPLHSSAWDAAQVICCSPISFGNKSYPHFACVLGRCDKCSNMWTTFMQSQGMEPELECKEKIIQSIWHSLQVFISRRQELIKARRIAILFHLRRNGGGQEEIPALRISKD